MINKKFTLFDFLKSGISFESYIGIDFTQGKEHIEDMKTNQYMKAVAGIREILVDFVRDFQVYGYGANLNNPNEYSNTEFFNLSLKEDGILTGYTNIEKAYKDILYKINFCANSSLSPLINKIKMSIISKYKADTYSIIFLLVNSPPRIEDYQKCVDYLIENSKATYTSCNKDEVLSEDLDENIILELIYNNFFRGEEENQENKIILIFTYGDNLDYEGKTYDCTIGIISSQVKVREHIVNKSMNKLVSKTLERLEVYKETLNLGYRQSSQMDNSTLSYLCKLISEFN